eukprot:712780-Pelagomonas_calceolata.AAC.3
MLRRQAATWLLGGHVAKASRDPGAVKRHLEKACPAGKQGPGCCVKAPCKGKQGYRMHRQWLLALGAAQ